MRRVGSIGYQLEVDWFSAYSPRSAQVQHRVWQVSRRRRNVSYFYNFISGRICRHQATPSNNNNNSQIHGHIQVATSCSTCKYCFRLCLSCSQATAGRRAQNVATENENVVEAHLALTMFVLASSISAEQLQKHQAHYIATGYKRLCNALLNFKHSTQVG